MNQCPSLTELIGRATAGLGEDAAGCPAPCNLARTTSRRSGATGGREDGAPSSPAVRSAVHGSAELRSPGATCANYTPNRSPVTQRMRLASVHFGQGFLAPPGPPSSSAAYSQAKRAAGFGTQPAILELVPLRRGEPGGRTCPLMAIAALIVRRVVPGLTERRRIRSLAFAAVRGLYQRYSSGASVIRLMNRQSFARMPRIP